MKSLRFYLILALATAVLYSCSSTKKASNDTGKTTKRGITGLSPNVKTPSRGVLNASGDGFTPGIPSTKNNGAGSRENATNIANDAIARANGGVKIDANRFGALSNEDFLSQAGTSEALQIEMSRIAAGKTENSKIKEYAGMIQSDNQKIVSELKTLVAKKSISIPDSAMSGGQAVKTSADILNESMKAGKESFDFAYVEMMIADHRTEIRLFLEGSKSADADIKAFAAKHLPTLRKHLTEAQELTKQVSPKKK